MQSRLPQGLPQAVKMWQSVAMWQCCQQNNTFAIGEFGIAFFGEKIEKSF
jgi:hypothetical protein